MVQIYETSNFNLMEFASIYNEFINTEEVKDLTVQYMDKKGIINTIQIKNVAAIKKEIKGDIDAEVKARMSGDTSIQETISHVSKDLIERINTEVQSRENYDKVLDSKIFKEINRAQDVEKAIEVTINGVKTELVNSIDDLQKIVNQEIQRAKDSESKIIVKIDDEIERAKAAENNIVNQLQDEVERAKTIETKIDKKVTDEIVRAQDIENKLNLALTNEIQRAKETEDQIEDKVISEAQRAQSTEKNIQENLDKIAEDLSKEVVERIKKDGSLKFNEDIKTINGKTAEDLTGAINIVDNRLNESVKELISSDDKLKNYIDNQIGKLINGAPEVLDTINELADALGDDPNFAKTISEKIAKINSNVGNLDKLTTNIKTNLVSSLNELNSKIINETQVRAVAIEEIINDIKAETDRARKGEENLLNSIKSEINRAQTVENNLEKKIEKEEKIRELVDKEIKEDLINEIQRAKTTEGNILKDLNKEIQRAETTEQELKNSIKQETTERIDDINSLTKTVIQERKDREEQNAQININLNNEIKRAQTIEGNLEFNKDIRKFNGSKPANLTEAINIVDDKICTFEDRIIRMESIFTNPGQSSNSTGKPENDLSDTDILNLKKFIDSLF